MRHPHYLRATQTAEFPHDLVCFDTETVEKQLDPKTVEHCLEFGWAARLEFTSRLTWTEPTWFRFTEAVEFWKWLETQCRAKRALWVYCHNANFDWQVCRMTTLLPLLGWKCDTAILEDPPNYFRWRKDGKTLKLLDSTNYWKEKLSKLGEKLGLAKLDFPTDWSNRDQSDTYCRRDVEILYRSIQAWIEFLREHDLGGLGISLAQQAWKAYTHRFMDAPIFIDDNERALELARDAYYGGRVECLTLGTQVTNVHCVDINSMYPYVMREYEYPSKLHGRYTRVKLDELSRWVQRYCVCARVLITTNEPVYPERTEHGLVFPVGQFETCLSTPELAYAIEHGHIVECSEAAIYSKARLFPRFVDYFYTLRLDAASRNDELDKYYFKILPNSLYGKFGQRSGHEEIIGECNPLELYVETELDMATGKRYRNRHIAGLILSRSQDAEGRQSHPAIAAHVSAHARMILWNRLIAAGPENTHYMDTDSLHVSADGYARLARYMDTTALGGFKLEKVINRAIYYGPKDYELDGMRKIKGVSASAVETDIATFSQSQWVSLKGACLIDHSGGPLVRRVSKRYRRIYRKGERLPSGRTLPIWRFLAHIRRVVKRD